MSPPSLIRRKSYISFSIDSLLIPLFCIPLQLSLITYLNFLLLPVLFHINLHFPHCISLYLYPSSPILHIPYPIVAYFSANILAHPLIYPPMPYLPIFISIFLLFFLSIPIRSILSFMQSTYPPLSSIPSIIFLHFFFPLPILALDSSIKNNILFQAFISPSYTHLIFHLVPFYPLSLSPSLNSTIPYSLFSPPSIPQFPLFIIPIISIFPLILHSSLFLSSNPYHPLDPLPPLIISTPLSRYPSFHIYQYISHILHPP